MADKEPEEKRAPESRDTPKVLRVLGQPWVAGIAVGDPGVDQITVDTNGVEVPAEQVDAVYQHALTLGVLVEEVVT